MPKSKKVARTVKRKRRGPTQPASGLPNLVAQLTRTRNELVARRDALGAQIAALDGALTAMGAKTAARLVVAKAVGRRGPRAGSLKDHIARVLREAGGPMRVKDIAAGVLQAGYQTKNQTLAKSIGIAMRQMPDVRKVRRGVFRYKG